MFLWCFSVGVGWVSVLASQLPVTPFVGRKRPKDSDRGGIITSLQNRERDRLVQGTFSSQLC